MAGMFLALLRLPVLVEVEADVVPYGLRKAGGGNADCLRAVLADEVVEGSLEVIAAAEYRARLAEVGGRDVDGLLEMADHVPADIGRTALRAVNEGDAALDPPEGNARPQGRTELARVPCRDERLRPFFTVFLRFCCSHLPPSPWIREQHPCVFARPGRTPTPGS